MGCEECKGNPVIGYEAGMALAERTIRRLWLVIVLLIFMLVGTNIAWVVYENSFMDIMVEQEAEADGDGIAINANGEVNFNGGEGSAED